MSLIPLSYAQGNDAQAVVHGALEALRLSVHRFETVASHLLDQGKDDVESHELLRDYVNACMQMSTGNLAWRLATLSHTSLDMLTRVTVCEREDMVCLDDGTTTVAS